MTPDIRDAPWEGLAYDAYTDASHGDPRLSGYAHTVGTFLAFGRSGRILEGSYGRPADQAVSSQRAEEHALRMALEAINEDAKAEGFPPVWVRLNCDNDSAADSIKKTLKVPGYPNIAGVEFMHVPRSHPVITICDRISRELRWQLEGSFMATDSD